MTDKLSLLLLGDLHIQRADPESIIRPTVDYLRAADIRFGNLEIIPTDVRRPHQGRNESNIRSDESNFPAYTFAGFDAVGLSNNHSMDQGLEGLLRSIELLDKAGIVHTGGGRNGAEARTPAIIERKGTRVAFLSYTSVFAPGVTANDRWGGIATMQARASYEAHPGAMEAPGTPPITHTHVDPADLERLHEDVQSARQQADIVVVSWHWGLSPKTGGDRWIPVLEYQTEGGRAAIDAGADMVFGHHPHMLQPIEVYKDRPIFYSVGNFAFDFFAGRADPRLQRAALVRVAIENRAVSAIYAVPVWIGLDGNPTIASGLERDDIIAVLHDSSKPLGTVLEPTPDGLLVTGRVPALV